MHMMLYAIKHVMFNFWTFKSKPKNRCGDDTSPSKFKPSGWPEDHKRYNAFLEVIKYLQDCNEQVIIQELV